ncbi:MAG TPA: hypothetical protein VET23_02735 [Chitinophagaceae bacterium]|nr:hypothetical protein [Chitinophagaceae bacterium]
MIRLLVRKKVQAMHENEYIGGSIIMFAAIAAYVILRIRRNRKS